MNKIIYHTWQNIGGIKYWQMYAYQTFGGNKLANHVCSTYIQNILKEKVG